MARYEHFTQVHLDFSAAGDLMVKPVGTVAARWSGDTCCLGKARGFRSRSSPLNPTVAAGRLPNNGC